MDECCHVQFAVTSRSEKNTALFPFRPKQARIYYNIMKVLYWQLAFIIVFEPNIRGEVYERNVLLLKKYIEQ